MTVTFVSNYINHHQLPFCDACFKELGNDFTFIQSIPMEEERIQMGWQDEGEQKQYVKFLYKDKKLLELLVESDILVAGWSGVIEVEATIIKRLKAGKPTFRISERIYKTGQWKIISPRGLYQKYMEYTRFRKHPYYLLCAGSYVASDFELIKAFPGKKYRWGYFPKTVHYDEGLWTKKKATDEVQICWVGRFIPLKHPEKMIKLALDLNKQGYSFHLHMVGSGEMENALHKETDELGLADMITFHGKQTPMYVREVMDKSHIFVFTSNHIEGWGAVLSEAMNSGLAVVASTQAGASRYLIENGKNGFYYHINDYFEMLTMVKNLLDNPEQRKEVGKNAYDTITNLWNAENAASELLRVCRELLTGHGIKPAPTGPLSIAPLIKP